MAGRTSGADATGNPDRVIEQIEWPIDLRSFEALLFDLDGTLVDTMSLHYRSYAKVFAARGFYLSEQDYLSRVGPPAAQVIPLFCKAVGMPNVLPDEVIRIHTEKKVTFGRLLDVTPPPLLPAASLLKGFRTGQRRALVSSGNSQGVHQIIAAAGWQNLFDCIISGDDVAHGKPHPEPYLSAASLLGVRCGRCVVLEDTQAGIDSAIAAGMHVIDVSGPSPLLISATS
jgi:beta-phosphoglucomutase-like phosphatase (HAD superfamily)